MVPRGSGCGRAFRERLPLHCRRADVRTCDTAIDVALSVI
jgi:hypothetical protein